MLADPHRLLEWLMVMALPMSGGGDLLDFVSIDAYWNAKNVPITAEAMTAELHQPRPPDISGLIRQLGHSRFATRETATRRIQSLGPSVVGQLTAALASEDPEVVDRLRLLIGQMGVARRATAQRRLMAIRTLGQIRSREALAELRRLTESKEVFVAEYARDAIARIENKPLERRRPGRKELDEDLWLLPKGCGCVGQLSIRSRIDWVSGPGRDGLSRLDEFRDDDSAQSEFAKRVLTLSDQIGNFRVDAITMALSGDASGQTGWMAFVVRGQYDREAIKAIAEEFKWKVESRDGIDVVSESGSFQWILPSRDRLIFVVGTTSESPVDSFVSAFKSGRGTLADDEKLAALVKNADRTGPFWMAATGTDAYRRLHPVLEGIAGATVSTKQKGMALSAEMTVYGLDGQKLAASEKHFTRLLRDAIVKSNSDKARVSLFQSVYDFVKSVRHERRDATGTITAEVNDMRSFMVLRMIVWSLRYDD